MMQNKEEKKDNSYTSIKMSDFDRKKKPKDLNSLEEAFLGEF